MIALLAVGSSPLARGLPTTGHGTTYRYGIIPARAGFTRPGARSRSTLPGSSPLARGLRHAPAHADGRGGIIPARAGFTPGRPRRDQLREDYPRSRGVYSAMSSRMTSRAGSSPLARGLHGDSTPSGASLGIIPARAGFTMRWARVEARRSDHPRSRGVYPCSTSAAPTGPGSSPLARGLQGNHNDPDERGGIIPARAGFTWRRRWRSARRRDHPRSRGVYTSGTGAPFR